MNDFTLDEDRVSRLGFPEIIYGEAKNVEQLTQIIKSQIQKNKSCFITRLQTKKAVIFIILLHF